MCREETHIKLCTCGDTIPKNNYWKLYRPSDKGFLHMMGDFVLVTPPAGKALLEAKIASDLNQYECFDFDYVPQVDDMLKIKLGGKLFTYRVDALKPDTSSEVVWGLGGTFDSHGMTPDNAIRQGEVQTAWVNRPRIE